MDVQSLYAVTLTCTSINGTMFTPCALPICCSHSAAFGTLPSQPTTLATFSTLSSPQASTPISDVQVGVMVSDHALIRFTLHVNRLASDTQKVTRRAWRRLSIWLKLSSDLSECEEMSVDDLVQLYNRVMTRVQSCWTSIARASPRQACNAVVRR